MTFLKNVSVPHDTEDTEYVSFALLYGDESMNDSLLTRIA